MNRIRRSLLCFVGLSAAASLCAADQTGLGTFRDPLAYELPDNGRSGLVLRDPAECGSTAANCQDWSRTTPTGGRSADLVPIAALNGDDFKVADNFTVTAAQTLSSICFWGFYGSTAGPGAGAFPAAGAEAFRIRVYGNTGAPNSGIPDSNNILREWTVGANAGYGLTVDPNTTLTRTGTGATRPGVFGWTVNLGASALNLAPGCYWLEVVGATDGIVEGNRLRWAIVNVASPSNDGVVYQGLHTTSYSYLDLIGGTTTATDMAFCLNFALNTNGGCNIPPAPTNATCANSQTITAPFTATNVSTLRAQTTVTPFCGNNPVNGNTLWYKVVGDGSTFTASTCGANTNFDTVINVYCSLDGTCGTSNANLLCVANNDTGPTTCTSTGGDPSEVSWASVAGATYYIAVFGFELDAGFLDFSLTSAAGSPGAPCASDRCAVTLPSVIEPDACGVTTNSAASCNGGALVNFTLGTDFGGTSYNLGTTRDFDFWELDTATTPIPDTTGAGTAWLDVVYSVEFPGIFNFFNGACAGNNGTFLGGAFANYLDGGPACPRAVIPRTIQLQTLAGGQFRLNLLPVDFGGVPCSPGNNNYSISVTLSAVGGCCIPATACFVTAEADCLAQSGTWAGAGIPCSPVDPCDPANGACCVAGACSITTSAGCSGTFQGAATTCSPNPCPQVSNIACCRGATCSVLASAACTDPAGTAGAFATTATACNASGSATTPCCYADYNKVGGIEIQDIFDFLNDWFGGSNFADTGGDGTTAPDIQSIFDFLNAWFAGGC